MNYIETRNTLIVANEGYSTNVYFDTNGIPTVGTGVALLQSDGTINTANMQILSDVLGADSTLYSDIQAFAQRASDAVKGTPSMVDVHKSSEFMATERGKAIVKEFGVSPK